MDLERLIFCFRDESHRLSGQSPSRIRVKIWRIMIQIKDGLTDEFSRFDPKGVETFAF